MQAAGKSIYSTGLTPADVAQINSGSASISELTGEYRHQFGHFELYSVWSTLFYTLKRKVK